MEIAKEFSDNIIFTGFIDYKDLPVFHAIANVQVVPSRWGEPLGNVVIEGIASGIKQIVTDDGGIKEMVKDTDATIIDTEDLINNIYKAMDEIIKNNNYERTYYQKEIEKFSEETYSKNIFQLLNKNNTKK